MKTHESPVPRNGRKGQLRRGAKLIMQVHENRCIKRAGVAGLRLRAIVNKARLNKVNSTNTGDKNAM